MIAFVGLGKEGSVGRLRERGYVADLEVEVKH